MNRFNKREKYMLYLAAGLIGALIVARLLVFPVIDSRVRLKRVITAKTATLLEVRELASELEALENVSAAGRKRMGGTQKGFTLFAFLDGIAGETALKDRIAYMKPSPRVPEEGPYKVELVEMKLQAVTLQQLVAYLHKIETSENAVFIKRISIVKPDKCRGGVNAVMEIKAFST